LQDIVRAIRVKGAALKATEQPIDTGTAACKCFLDMLGVFAEFETNLRKERQLEGIAKAKAQGVYKGRPASIDVAQIREMKAQYGGARHRCRQGSQHPPRERLSGVGGKARMIGHRLIDGDEWDALTRRASAFKVLAYPGLPILAAHLHRR